MRRASRARAAVDCDTGMCTTAREIVKRNCGAAMEVSMSRLGVRCASGTGNAGAAVSAADGGSRARGSGTLQNPG